ncbi:hypothetical protein D3C85_1652350 [compost metagenome]
MIQAAAGVDPWSHTKGNIDRTYCTHRYPADLKQRTNAGKRRIPHTGKPFAHQAAVLIQQRHQIRYGADCHNLTPLLRHSAVEQSLSKLICYANSGQPFERIRTIMLLGVN